MEQGFSAEGFSAPSAPVEALAKMRPGAVHKPNVAGQIGQATAMAKGARSAGAADHATAGSLNTIKSWAMFPSTLLMVGMLGDVAQAIGLKKVGSAVATLFNAPVDAMRATGVFQAFTSPRTLAANWFKAVSTHAPGMGERGKRWASEAGNRAVQMERSIAQNAVPTAAVIDKGTLPGAVKGMVNWGSSFADARGAAHTEKALKAATTEGRGFFGQLRGFLTFNKAAVVDAGALAQPMRQLQAADNLSGLRKAEHLSKLVGTLTKQVEEGKFADEALHRAKAVLKHATKAMNSAHTTEMLSNASRGGFKTLMNVVGKAAGRIPVFNALLGAGIVAGIGATYFASRGESKEAKAAYKGLIEDLGGDMSSPFAKAMKSAHQSQKGWSAAKLGLETVGNVADGMMWMAPGGVGAAMISAQMLPMLITGFVPGNPSLSSLVALKKDYAGEIKLNTQEKVQANLQMIKLMPSVASKGGEYNRLAHAVAVEMVETKMSPRETVQLLSNDQAFTAYATQVHNKMQAAKAKAIHPAAESKAHVAPVAKETAVTGKAEAANAAQVSLPTQAANDALAHHAAAKPGVVALANVENHGRLSASPGKAVG